MLTVFNLVVHVRDLGRPGDMFELMRQMEYPFAVSPGDELGLTVPDPEGEGDEPGWHYSLEVVQVRHVLDFDSSEPELTRKPHRSVFARLELEAEFSAGIIAAMKTQGWTDE